MLSNRKTKKYINDLQHLTVETVHNLVWQKFNTYKWLLVDGFENDSCQKLRLFRHGMQISFFYRVYNGWMRFKRFLKQVKM